MGGSVPNKDIYFVTNRNPINEPVTDFGNGFSPVDGKDLRYGEARVDLASGKMTKLTVYDQTLHSPAVATRSSRDDRYVFGSARVHEISYRGMCDDQADLIVLIHGFWNNFQESVERAAGLARYWNKLDWPLVAFCWPSNGSAGKYVGDRKNAERSGPAMGRAIGKLTDFLATLKRKEWCGQRIHLVAHSMGNYLLRHAVQSLIKDYPDGRVPRIFENVFLIAADEDADALDIHFGQQKLLPVTGMARRVTVYHTVKDFALFASDDIKFNPDRLGHDGPKRMAATPDNVTAVDVFDVVEVGAARTESNHGYHRSVDAVRDDIAAVLAGTEPHAVPKRVAVPREARRYKITV